MGDDYQFTDGQKATIYNKDLKTLKLRISQIALYDPKGAAEFLRKYNELIENTPDSELIKKITELEWQLTSYEKGEGQQRSFSETRKILIRQIEELEQISDNLSLADFEQEVEKLMNRYTENLKNYEFDDRDALEEKLYEVKAKLIMRQVKEYYPERIELSPDEEIGLMVYMSQELNRLSKNKNPKAQSYIERIKYNIMGGMKALHDSETWKLLSYAQRENFIGEEEKTQIIAGASVTPQTNALAVVKDTNRGSFLRTITRLFSKEPKLPLQVGDLKKISIDWLAQYIPQEMAEDLEKKQLQKEGKNPEECYVPDGKKVIFELMDSLQEYKVIKGIIWDPQAKTFKPYDGKSTYIDKNGHEKIQECAGVTNHYWVYIRTKNNHLVAKEPVLEDTKSPEYILYADFLDKVFKTNFKQKVLQVLEREIIEFDAGIRPSKKISEKYPNKVYKELVKSYKKLLQQYKSTRADFLTDENERRYNFYKKQEENRSHQIENKSSKAIGQSFRESIMVKTQGVIDAQGKSKDIDIHQNQEQRTEKDEQELQ